MKFAEDVVAYNAAQTAEHAAICESLMKLFSKSVAEADAKVWHGHPVWFIDGNPVFGYSIKKSGVQVLFWSGQSFKTEGLTAIGKFKAAGVDVAKLNTALKGKLQLWLTEAKAIQWDYANLPKKRALEKLTKF